MTLWPFAPLIFPSTSSLLWPLLTSCPLSPARSPRVRTCTFEPGRQALPDMAFGDGWISRSLARSSPISGLSACFCSCGRLFATPFFQPHLTASTLGFATLVVTACDDLLSDHKYMPMSGTLAAPLVGAKTVAYICGHTEWHPQGVPLHEQPAGICSGSPCGLPSIRQQSRRYPRKTNQT